MPIPALSGLQGREGEGRKDGRNVEGIGKVSSLSPSSSLIWSPRAMTEITPSRRERVGTWKEEQAKVYIAQMEEGEESTKQLLGDSCLFGGIWVGLSR